MTGRRVALLQRAYDLAAPALARRLARAGHDLVLHLPREGLAAEVEALGAAVEVVGEDETPFRGAGSDFTREGWDVLVARTLGRFGRLDAAGLQPPRDMQPEALRRPFMSETPERWRAMAAHVETTIIALQAVIPAIAKGGQIVVFASDQGVRPAPEWSLYGAARQAQAQLVRAVALEHARDGLCLNVIGSKNAAFEGFPHCPPGAVTDGAVISGAWSAPLEAETPLGRLGTMEEYAAFAQVLLDGSNRFQTAQYFSFSGGWNAL